MKKYTNKVLKIVPYIALSILVGVTAVYAGSTLTPPSSVSNTMYSLTDIYNLASGTTVDEGTGEIDATPSEVSLSGKSLSDVYEAISTEIAKLTSSILLEGNTVFGVDGGASSGSSGANLSNMWNGTGTEAAGGSQANGGIDDANYDSNWVPQTPPEDRYEANWEKCEESNNYCETGDTGADAKDLNTGIIWSYPLKNTEGVNNFDTSAPDLTGCETGSCAYQNIDTYYSWDSSNTNNNSKTASGLCQEQGENWYLPHQKQLMQAYIDGAYGNLESIGVVRGYWSATTLSGYETHAWYVDLSGGGTGYYYKYYDNVIRCVQE